MSVVNTRRHFLQVVLTGSTLSVLSGCGTFMHPERRGQPAGRIDWKVVTLDGLTTLLLVVPGLIAFAIDFGTGAIYLPPEPEVPCEPSTMQPPAVGMVLPRHELDRRGIEAAVSRHINKPVSLAPDCYLSCKLNSIDEFWSRKSALEGHSLADEKFVLS
ncbi:hypothetical protein [Planctomicrobium sp. SH664]|uniref:hypothetical protein n=1 Tax=Planctomicrobium sp. SH664 TaxID=3448125 RepID=UPI003F5B3902